MLTRIIDLDFTAIRSHRVWIDRLLEVTMPLLKSDYQN